MFRVSADIGGTFTDIVVEDTTNKNIKTIKVLTTPENPANAVFEGLNSNLNIKDINFIVHGTTVGLNAFLEKKGSRVLLIMTKGISDTYTIARGDRKELYNVQYSKPSTLVPRKDVVEVDERIMWDGSIHTSLNENDLSKIAKIINDEDIKAVAVCYLHSYVNPEHEIKTRKFLSKQIAEDVVILYRTK